MQPATSAPLRIGTESSELRADRAQIDPGELGGPGILRGIGQRDLVTVRRAPRSSSGHSCEPDRCPGCVAVALLVVAVQAGEPVTPVVELPEAHAARRERAPHRLGQPPERIPIPRLEQGSGRGEFVEGGGLRRQRLLPPAERAGVAIGDHALIGEQPGQADRQGDDAAGEKQGLAAVGSDETDQVILGDDEQERPVPRRGLGERRGRHDVALVVDLDDRPAGAGDPDPVVRLGEHRIADRAISRGPILAVDPVDDPGRVGIRDQPARAIDDQRASVRAELEVREEAAELGERDVAAGHPEELTVCAADRARYRQARLLRAEEHVDGGSSTGRRPRSRHRTRDGCGGRKCRPDRSRRP